MDHQVQWQISLAGSAAALSVDALIYPLDTIKTRLQSPDPFSRRNLFRGLYRGVAPVVAATIPSSAIFFLTYESTKRVLQRTAVPLAVVHFASGCFGELASCLILTPVEVIKSRIQVSTSTSPPGSSFLHLMRALSWKPLLQGYATLAGRNLPFTGLQFPIFERLKLSNMPSWAAGAVAGATAALATTPVDVIKTRAMVRQGSTVSLHRLVLELWQAEGARAFTRGGLMRFSWAGAGSGLYLGTYDAAKSWLQRRGQGKKEPVDRESD